MKRLTNTATGVYRRPDGDPVRWVRMMAVLVTVLAAAAACGGDQPDLSQEGEVHDSLPAPLSAADSDQTNTAPWQGRSGIARHQHDAQHGGYVRSVDVYHVEIASDPVAVWLYDRRGNPMPVDEVEGQIVVYSDDERNPVELDPVQGRLVPVEEFELPSSGTAFVELTIDQHPIDVAYALPLGSEAAQAADLN